jgi:adenine-specific DNA-methyltransferase
MEKLEMHTADLAKENYEKLAALFPNAVTETIDEEGHVIRAIDKDVLMQEINTQVVDDGQERYQFTWPDKRKTIMLANQPIAKTLRLDREKSVSRDGTQGGDIDSENIYIEGDNLDALKILRETYLGKVKMIYIDPPYNTGGDFVYNDNFSKAATEYIDISGQYDDEGNRLVQNTDSNGRFHTDWLNMIYPRLKIVKDFLSDGGVIIISIDDHEIANFKKICDEIFDASNFIGITVRVSSPTQNVAKFISIMHDYALMYCKNIETNEGNWRVKKNNAEEFKNRAHKLWRSGLSSEKIADELRALTKYPKFYDFDHYYYCDDKGVFRAGPIGGVQKGNTTTQILHPITHKPCKMPKGGWRYKDSELKRLINNKMILFGDDETVVPQTKLYLNDYLMQVPKGINFFDTQKDVHFLSDNGLPFDFPKPVEYIKYLESMVCNKNSVIMDFFAGSATTAHATMSLNADDNGRRKFILVQIPQQIDSKNYNNICEVGEKRIKIAAKEINKNTGADIDYGFRCFKVDSSNMKDVYYKPADMKQNQMDLFADNIKEDRTPEDLLIQVMLDLGVLLSSKIEETEIAGKKVFSVENGYLIACFDENVTEEVVTAIAKQHPYYAVFRDSSMADDSVAANFEQIFMTYSPQTVRKVL